MQRSSLLLVPGLLASVTWICWMSIRTDALAEPASESRTAFRIQSSTASATEAAWPGGYTESWRRAGGKWFLTALPRNHVTVRLHGVEYYGVGESLYVWDGAVAAFRQIDARALAGDDSPGADPEYSYLLECHAGAGQAAAQSPSSLHAMLSESRPYLPPGFPCL